MLSSPPKTSTTVMEISTAVIGSAKRSRKMGSACTATRGLSAQHLMVRHLQGDRALLSTSSKPSPLWLQRCKAPV